MLKVIKGLFLLSILFVSMTKVEATEPSFSVEPIKSNIQINNQHTYFDLAAKVNQKEILSVRVHNHLKRTLTVVGEVNRATTSENGLVEYGVNDTYNENIDDDLQFNLKELVRPLKSEINIPAGETGIYKFELLMPKEEVIGILAGGINFKEKKSSVQTPKDKLVGVNSEITYKVGVVINGNTDIIKKDLQVLRAFSNTVDQVTSIGVTLKNNNPEFINELSIDTKIIEDNTQKVIYSDKNENLQMAPNSHLNYVVFMTNAVLPSGTYTVEVTVTSGERIWKEIKQLVIGNPENIKDALFEKYDRGKFLGELLGVIFLIGMCVLVMIVFVKINKSN